MKFNEPDLVLEREGSDDSLNLKSDNELNKSNERINVGEKIVIVESVKGNEKPFVESNVTREHFSPTLRQCIAASAPLILTVCSGLTSGYSAILLPQLNSTNSTIQITRSDSSWIASMAALPMALGCLIGGTLMERYGRKITQILINMTFLLGWALIIISTSILHLLVGRFFTGLAVGISGPVVSVYIAETSSPKLRGTFLAVISFSISLGILIAHILGTFYTWRTTAIMSALSPLISLSILFFIPETPNYLASIGEFHKAEISYRWLRGSSMTALEEMEQLLIKYRKVFKEKSQIGQSSLTFQQKFTTFTQKLSKSYFWKPFLVMNAFFAITQCSGVNAVAFYSVDIIQDTMGKSFNSYLAMAIIDITRLILSVLACILLRKCTRRSLAIFSSAGTAVILLSLATFISQCDVKSNPDLAFIPLISLVLYICFISVGLVPLPWVMLGEIFPSAVRSVGTGLCSCMCFIYFFGVVKTAPFIFYDLGAMYAYVIYGMVSLIGCVILFVFLPETKGKTLEQIEATWMYKKECSNVTEDGLKRSDIMVS